MSIVKSVFGTNSKGEEILKYTLTNGSGMSVDLIEVGAAIQSLNVPDKQGNVADVVLGFDNVEMYEKYNGDKHGAVVGRYANRVALGKFTLNGKEYKLEQNDGVNTLHNGSDCYNSRKWDSEIVDSENGDSVCFSLESADRDQGMPGNLSTSVTYTLTEDNSLIIEYSGVSDQDTAVNMTNHSYFNLGGHNSGKILDHEIWLNADEFTPTDSGLIPTGEIRKVVGTPMDFTTAKRIGLEIGADYEPLRFARGYDHNYVLKNNGENELVGSLYDPASGRLMEVYTDMPGIQIYTGNSLGGMKRGKENCYYSMNDGVCFETQFFPDSINISSFPSPFVKAQEEFYHVTVYKFTNK